MPSKPRAGRDGSAPASQLQNQLMESKEARCPPAGAWGLHGVPVAQEGGHKCH